MRQDKQSSWSFFRTSESFSGWAREWRVGLFGDGEGDFEVMASSRVGRWGRVIGSWDLRSSVALLGVVHGLGNGGQLFGDVVEWNCSALCGRLRL